MKYSSLIALVVVALASVAQVSAQEEGETKPLISQKEYDEMLMWMVNGKYEKVLYKAIRYTESEKTANEPLPYAYMAEAYGKLTGRPGICMVTRGPGATNAAIGVHCAQQDSTPMILFVG
ncbi:MAG: thiamine pyrophosphate-binding protein, partial [Flavobacteriales bacterium]